MDEIPEYRSDNSLTAKSSESFLRPQITTSAPASSSASANCLPSPSLPPVTKALRFDKSKSVIAIINYSHSK
jgi:hypothetical protein